MNKIFSIPPMIRLFALLSTGALVITFSWLFKDLQHPKNAPKEINNAGIQQLMSILSSIQSSEFGQTKRGSIISSLARKLIKYRRVLFSDDLADQSLYWRQLFRPSVIYIALIHDRDSLHQIPNQISLAQALFHETVHAIKETGCLEEECDCFIAAAQAVAALKNEKLNFPVKIVGDPVWTWVNRVYGGNRCSLPTYEPVGETKDWLISAAGIK